MTQSKGRLGVKALNDALSAAVLQACRNGRGAGVADTGWDEIRRGLTGPIDGGARAVLDATLFVIVGAEMTAINAERPE